MNMQILRRLLSLLRHRESTLAMLIAMVAAAVGLVDANFLSTTVWRDILVRSAPTAIVACGVMLVVVTGEIDISVGSMMAVLAAVLGRLVSSNEAAVSCWIGIPFVLLIGTSTGLLTGVLVAWGRVPSIIVTLGLLTALRGAATLLMDGRNIDSLPDSLTSLAKKGLPWDPLGIPICVWMALFVIASTAILIASTPLGRRLYALGSSAESARMAGLNHCQLKLFVFALTGFLTALATVVDVPRLPRIESGIGSGLELLVVTCVVVGGVSVSGGRGTVLGVMLAVVLLTMVRPVLTFLDIGEAGEKWTRAIQGLFILFAVISDVAIGRNKFRQRTIRIRPQESTA